MIQKKKVKVKVKLILEQAKKTQGAQRYSSTLYSTLALDWGLWSMPQPGCFTTGKDTWHPLYRLGGFQGWTGQAQKITPPTRI